MLTDADLSKEFRDKFSLTQPQAAEVLSVHLMTVSRWERGVHPMTLPTRVALILLMQMSWSKAQRTLEESRGAN